MNREVRIKVDDILESYYQGEYDLIEVRKHILTLCDQVYNEASEDSGKSVFNMTVDLYRDGYYQQGFEDCLTEAQGEIKKTKDMKLLTEKCREDFEKFLISFYYNQESETRVTAKLKVASFHNYPLSMQWGVIQDFGDSVGINITIYQLDNQDWYGYNIAQFGKPVITCGVWRRDRARELAIIHFNNVYNNENN